MPYKEINPNVWKPEQKGDLIEGRVVSIKDAVGTNKSKQYHIDTFAGEQKFFWGSTILDDKLIRAKIGNKIRVTFMGKSKNAKGQALNLYKVEIDSEEDSDAPSTAEVETYI